MQWKSVSKVLLNWMKSKLEFEFELSFDSLVSLKCYSNGFSNFNPKVILLLLENYLFTTAVTQDIDHKVTTNCHQLSHQLFVFHCLVVDCCRHRWHRNPTVCWTWALVWWAANRLRSRHSWGRDWSWRTSASSRARSSSRDRDLAKKVAELSSIPTTLPLTSTTRKSFTDIWWPLSDSRRPSN